MPCREANEKLTQLSLQKDAFLSQISHELRTPMTSIRAFSELLKEGGLTLAEQQHFAGIIADEAVRLTRLLDDLLDLSVLENGGGTLSRQEGLLSRVLDRAVAAAGITPQGLRVLRHRGDEGIALTTDLDRLSQVFINLIANAQKYCVAGRPELRITVRRDGGQVVIDFVDNGQGIPPEHQAVIFEKFARLSDPAKAGGAGWAWPSAARSWRDWADPSAICRDKVARRSGSRCPARRRLPPEAALQHQPFGNGRRANVRRRAGRSPGAYGQDCMAGGQTASVLRRLTRPAPQADAPVTPTRALRLALTRAAERSAGLGLSVLGVTEEVVSLDTLLATTDPKLMLMSLTDGATIKGFVGIDLELRTALIEVQTMGRLRASAAESRPITATDAALSQPLITAFLLELVHGTEDTPLQGWADGYQVEGRLGSLRAAELAMQEGDYRLVRMTLDLAAGERQAALVMALSVPRSLAAAPRGTPPPPRFAEALRANVMSAEAELLAILHRFHLPLSAAERFAVGQVLPLPGVTVSSVRIETTDGRIVGRGRLGQSAGLRAVRVEVAMPPTLSEATLSGAIPSLPGWQGGGEWAGMSMDGDATADLGDSAA